MSCYICRFIQTINEIHGEKTKLLNMAEVTKKTVQQKDRELEDLRNWVRFVFELTSYALFALGDNEDCIFAH